MMLQELVIILESAHWSSTSEFTSWPLFNLLNVTLN